MSIIALPNDYTIVDFETTGFYPGYNSVIEVAALKIRNNQIIDTFTTLCGISFPLDDFIVKKTGITDEMLEGKPEFESVIDELINFIGSDIVVGHNIAFDVGFIKNLVSFNNETIDTLRLSRKLLPELPHHRLCDLIEHFSISADKLHRSVADCSATKDCFDKLKQSALEIYGTEEDFIKSFIVKKKYSHSGNQLKAADISSSNTEFDETHPLFGKLCVFTGKLDRMTRAEAMQLVVDFGGKVGDGVTSKTDFLILGNNDYCKSIKDGKSSKQKKAEAYALKGQDITILPEDVFYSLL